jgi:obg-like ATPase 1
MTGRMPWDARAMPVLTPAPAAQGLATKKLASKEDKEDLETARKVQVLLEADTDIRRESWNVKETAWLNQTQFISAKPVVYLVNMSEKDFIRKKNKHLPKVMEYVKANGGDPVIPYSAAFEQTIFDMSPEDQERARCSLHAPD